MLQYRNLFTFSENKARIAKTVRRQQKLVYCVRLAHLLLNTAENRPGRRNPRKNEKPGAGTSKEFPFIPEAPMELRAIIEHAVTHSPTPARSIACVCAAARQPPASQPIVFSAALRSLHTGGYVHRSDRIRSRSIDTGHACFVTVTPFSTAGRGLLITQSNSRKRTRWPACLAGRCGAVHARDPCIVHQHPRAPAEYVGRHGAYRDDKAARRACWGTRDGCSPPGRSRGL